MGHNHDLIRGLKRSGRDLRRHIPEVYEGFVQMNKAARAEGVLTKTTKELIGLAIAIAEQCDGCIASHARMAAKAGASEQEVAETIGVAISMMGGPGTVYGPRAWDAYQEFANG